MSFFFFKLFCVYFYQKPTSTHHKRIPSCRRIFLHVRSGSHRSNQSLCAGSGPVPARPVQGGGSSPCQQPELPPCQEAGCGDHRAQGNEKPHGRGVALSHAARSWGTPLHLWSVKRFETFTGSLHCRQEVCGLMELGTTGAQWVSEWTKNISE